MQNIPLHRVAVLTPFTEFLADVGTPVESALNRVGLAAGVLEDCNNFVPSEKYRRFIVDAAVSEGIPDLGFRVGERHGADCVAPRMTDWLSTYPTMYWGLTAASNLANKTVTHCRIGITRPRIGEYARFCHRPSCSDTRNPANEQIGWFGLMTLIDMVRVFAGPGWQPTEIGVMSVREPYGLARAHFPNASFKLLQPCNYVRIEASSLGLGPTAGQRKPFSIVPTFVEEVPQDLVTSLTRALRYVRYERLDIHSAAYMCSMSVRSLQRHLHALGTTYQNIAAQVRFDAARDMLADPDATVTSVAHHLGYSDSSNFCRAFSRVSGVSPRTYQKLTVGQEPAEAQLRKDRITRH